MKLNPAAPSLVFAAVLALLLPSCASQPHPDLVEVTGPRATAAYERLKRLEGEWESTSTKGWSGRVQYQVIANGSVLAQFDNAAHPGEMMLTLIHPDGERLLLSHYCAAQNQPRLVLTAANDALSEFTFEFLDGTNMLSRETGHMDKVTFLFSGDDAYTERWIWRQGGKSTKMEDVVSRRISRGTPKLPVKEH
jgi:hypothetical protein